MSSPTEALRSAGASSTTTLSGLDGRLRPPLATPPRLTTAQAVVLGALHGPAELLPISSSGHVAVMPWLLGWDYDRLDPELRKSFEVALHAGTAAALLITL